MYVDVFSSSSVISALNVMDLMRQRTESGQFDVPSRQLQVTGSCTQVETFKSILGLTNVFNKFLVLME